MQRLRETLSKLDCIVNLVGGNPVPLFIRSLGLFQSAPSAKKLYAESLAEVWKADNLHEKSANDFEKLIEQNKLDLLNLNDLNKRLITMLKEQGDLEPSVDAEQLFRKVVLKFEKKLSRQNPELMVQLFNEAIKEIEAMRQTHQHELDLSVRNIKHEHGERLVALEQDLRNLKALPAHIENYLRNYAAELFLLRGILHNLLADMAELRELTLTGSKIFALNESNQVVYVLPQAQNALPPSTADLAEALKPSALKFPQPSYRQDRDAPSQLLNSEYEIVPFYGRDTELKELLDWCNADKKFDLKLYTGAGGMGKTRLMREVIRYLNTSEATWQAGFIDRKTIENDPTSVQRLFKDDLPLFIVVDYAETQTEIVKKLLDAENTNVDKRTQSVRIVLLARTADTWWQQLRLESQRIDLPLEATPLAPVEESREDSFKRALIAFATSDEQANAIRTPELKESYYRSVLFVHMRALLATRSQQNPTTESELLDQILELEKQQWHKEKVNHFSQQELATAIAQIMTVVTLGYTLNNKGDLRDLLKEIPYTEHLGNQQPALNGLAERLRELYPGNLYLEPLRPDILGEHLLERTLLPEEDDPQTRSKLLSLAFDKEQSNLASAVEVLIRLMQRRERSGIVLFVETYQNRRENVALAKAITYQLPEALPISLGKVAVLAGRVAYQNSENKIEHATFANNLGGRLSTVGYREEALVTVQEAVEIYRELANTRHKAFLPDLAMSLNNLGKFLSDVSCEEEALASVKESLEIYRELAKTRPNYFFPDVAASLNNLGISLSNLGREEEALAATQEAVKIRREFARTRPETFLSDLARSLNNLGNRFKVLNRHEEAVASLKEALEIVKNLSEARPEAFLPYVAVTLDNLGGVLSNFNHLDEAVVAYQEALAIRRELAKEHSEVYRSDVAMTLHNLGDALSKLNHLKEAIEVYRETLKIYRELAQEGPEVYHPDIAMNLNNLGNALNNLNQHEEALEAYQEALAIRWKLAEKRPQIYLSEFAETIANMGYILNKPETIQTALACWVFAVYIFVSYQPRNITLTLQWLRDCKQITPNFDDLLKGLFPSGDILLKQATGQDFSFYAETSVEFADQILNRLNLQPET